ncbi:MAG: chitobiase/beta-hexosaminidase C-terminal domain-containing protein [Paludibacteraceae bacterium]|nr:chitobiase/beta-hexosaminidase C-terminal domain-containing protein [Paludibacteraceae bacterium]
MFVGTMFAADVTYLFSEDSDNPGNAQTWTSGTIDTYTGWSATKGDSNEPKYYTTGTGLRVYTGGTFTITSSKTLASVTLTFSGSGYTFSTDNTNTSQTVTPNATSYEWSVSRTCRLQKVEITYAEEADPSKCSTPTFSPVAGKYLGTQSVEITCTTDGATIYYTMGEDPADPTTSSTEYTGTIEVTETTSIKALAVKDGLTNSNIALATYTIVSVDHAGTAEDPYSVADAYTAIDNSLGLTNVYAQGIVSEVGTISSGALTYSISADGETTSDQLMAYKGKYTSGVDFTSSNIVRVGDEVIIYGTLTKYGSTYEFSTNNQLAALVARTPILAVEDVENLSVGEDDLAVSDLTIDKDGSEGAITLESGNTDVATIVDNKIHAIAAGDVTITANIAAADNYRAASTTFNVHVIEPCLYNVTLTLGTPENGTFESSRAAGDYPTCEGALEVVVTPTADEHYHVKAIVAPNSTSISDPVDGKYTITYAQNTNAASEINVTFEEDAKATVTWNVNGNTDLTTDVYVGEKPVFPATPAAFEANSNTFYGWATAAWSGVAANLTEKTVYTKASEMPEVAAAVTYYAVFAHKTESSTPANFTSTFTSKAWADANSLWTSGQDGGQLTTDRGVQVTTTYTGANATTKSSYDDVSSVVVTYSTNASKGAGTIAIQVGETEYTGDASVTTSGGTDDRTITYTAESNASGAVKITVTCTTNSIYIKSVQVNYSDVEVSYSDYITNAYAVTFSAPENGTLNIYEDDLETLVASGSSYVEGTQLYVDAQPAEGFKLKAVKVIKTGVDPEEDVTATVYDEGLLTIPAYAVTVSATFEKDEATGVDNTEAGVKAVKKVVNGQLLIEKNGRVYNAFGQTVK